MKKKSSPKKDPSFRVNRFLFFRFVKFIDIVDNVTHHTVFYILLISNDKVGKSVGRRTIINASKCRELTRHIEIANTFNRRWNDVCARNYAAAYGLPVTAGTDNGDGTADVTYTLPDGSTMTYLNLPTAG